MRFAASFRFAGLSAFLLTATLATPNLADETLYHQLGGQSGIARIVADAHGIFLSDDRVKDDFDNINPDHIRPRLAALICQLADGPCVYRGRPMAAAHEGLGLTRAKFNAVAEDLQAAMQQNGISYRTQNRLMALLAPLQREIVTK